MPNLKRFTMVAATGVVLALALSGCGRSDTPTGNAGGDTVTVDDSPATGDLTFWAMGGAADNVPPFLDAFEAQNPDVNIEVVNIPWNDVITRVQTALAAGEGPDVILLGSSLAPSIAASGALQPVPDGLTDAGQFFPAAIDTAEYDNVLYGVPWYVETRVLYYRKDIAAAQGLTPPTSWDELTSFAQGMKSAPGAQYGLQLQVGTTDGSTQVLLPFFAQAGGTAISNGEWTLDTPEMVDALNYYGSFFQNGLSNPAGTGDTSTADFVNGVSPAFISGPWQIPGLTEQQGADWVDANVGTVVVPAGPANNDSFIGGGHLGVFADSDNAASAWKLVRWLTQTDTEQDWYDQFGDLPSISSAWDYQPLEDDPWTQVLGAQLPNTVAPPAVPTWAELATFIETQSEQVVRGTATAEEVASAIQQKADSLGLGD